MLEGENVAVCTFFGHRECPEQIIPRLTEVLVDLIENHNVDLFYVGNQGRFDTIVCGVLRKLRSNYKHIDYAVVLAYIPERKREYEDYSDTIVPEGIESVPPRFAISWRNDWMLRHSDYIVTYVTHDWGGAYKYAQKAVRQSKHVRNLA